MKSLLLLFFTNVLCCLPLLAQYNVTTFTDNYIALDNELNLGIEEGWDDPNFALPFEFDFEFGNETVNSMTQLGLGSVLVSGPMDSQAVCGVFEDFIDGSLAFEGEPSFISYQLDGSEGNGICKLQFVNAAFYEEVEDEGTALNRINFQIWFYEIDNSVEFRFGPNNITTPELIYSIGSGPQIGIFTGVANQLMSITNAAALTGDPANPTVETSTDIEVIGSSSLDGTPEDGRVYRFDPNPLSVDNLKDSSFSLYPTLVKDQITINGEIPIGSMYRIIKITGEEVSNGVYENKQIFDVETLNPGMYILTMDHTKESKKFIKQ